MKLQINSLAVYAFGKKENPVIIFVHGFPFDHTMWEYQIKELQKDFYVIVYDIRGLGESYVGDGQYTMEAYVNDLFSIINQLNLVKPVLCGLSMGGYIALRAIEVDQAKFSGLILLDTVYKKTLKTSKKHNPIGVKGALFAMLSRTDTTKSLKQIKLPTLVMGGSFDKLTPPTGMRVMADKIKNSEFAIVPRAGHMSPLENPSFVNDMIKGFLTRRVVKN